MTVKNKTIKFISGLLIVTMLVPAVLFSKPKKAEAFWFSTWISDIFTTSTSGFTATSAGANVTQTAISIKNVAKEIVRQALMTIARRFLQEMTKSTINWINSGFHGNPLFLENPQSFFKDIAKYEVKTLVDTYGYDPLRFPFGKDFALNTINAYKRQAADNAQYSLSKVINDPVLLNNYRNDFNVGGWNGFLVNTQYPQNNYIGFQMLANEELARNLQGTAQNNAQKINTTLQQGMGFLSPQTCTTNPAYNNLKNEFHQPSFDMATYNKTHPFDANQYDLDPTYEARWNSDLAQAKSSWQLKNTCWPRSDGSSGFVNTTPGSVVANQITNAMGSQFRQSELAAAMGNSISAILDSLVNHFIDKGLNALSSKVNPKPPADDWSYNGQTLGSPVNGNNSSWDAGPDELIILSDFKQAVDDGINNTSTELQLIDNASATNPGIMQTLSQTWPKARELDMCIPGPDIGWRERTLDELSRNSKKLQGKLNDDDGDKSAQADLALKELKFAVDFFKDWINNKMLTELPDSAIYMDAVDEVKDLSQQADELTGARRTKSQALARLKSIKTALATFTTQPVTGSAQEKALISLKKQYNAAVDGISSTVSVEDMRNNLNVAKEKLANLTQLVPQCATERTAKGWTNPGGRTSTFLNKGTEENLFCEFPIAGGYDHESFTHANDDQTGTGKVTYPDLPYVNAKNVLHWRGKLGLFGHTANIQMSCNAIYKATVLDYKGNLPGTTTVIDPYVPVPDDTGMQNDPGSSSTNNTVNNSGSICASQAQIDDFLASNPGDEARLPSVFPCN